MHPRIPSLPTHVQGRAEFLDIMDSLFDFYKDADYPVRISGFGCGRRPDMIGGVMFSVFEAPRAEPIGSVRTTDPLLDVFDIVDGLRTRLRQSGVMVCYQDWDDASHVLTLERPGIPDQTWEYGIVADDVRAIELLFLHSGVDIRYG